VTDRDIFELAALVAFAPAFLAILFTALCRLLDSRDE